MTQPWVIYGLAFLAALLAVESLYWFTFRQRGAKKAINRRLALGVDHASTTEVFERLRQERGFADFKGESLAWLNDYFAQTGLRLSFGGLAVRLVLVFVALLVLFDLATRRIEIAGVIALLLTPLLLYFYFALARNRRIGRFGAQLPDAVDVIVRGLKVGLPFSSALDLVAREMADPIGSEFGMLADEMSFGQDIGSAVKNLYRRVGQDDLLFLVIAVTVQTQTGGNLAEILARLSKLMRERSKLRLKIRALSAEGRMSAWFLSAMPFILFAVIELIAPSYFDEVRKSLTLVPALVYGGVSLLLANYAIYRMVNFKV